jgi:HlyD family secretion protein
MKNFLTSHTKLIALIVVILVAIGSVWYIAANKSPVLGSFTVTKGNVIEALDEPATVDADNNSGLSFQESGQIADVYVQEGQVVTTGQKLADLDSASLEAGLQQAKATLATAQANYQELQSGDTPDQIAVSQAALYTAQAALQNASSTLNSTENQQDTAVQNAYNALLNTTFSAVPGSGNTDSIQATISGTYNGNTEGTYYISIYSTGSGLKFKATGLENSSGNVQSQPVALGTRGLYIQFSGQPSSSDTWTVSIPNTYASSYTTNYNAYQAALQTQAAAMTGSQAQVTAAQAAVLQAQANLQLAQSPPRSEDIEKDQAAVDQAQAAVASAQVALDNALLTAPFPGTVQNLTAQVGQVVSPNNQVLTLVNNGGLKIEAYVSEADITKIKVGNTADITLDAFGTGTTFPAVVTAIDSTQTQINGTPSYLVELHFTSPEPQISSGMTGNAHIVLAEDDNVLEVPSQLVINDQNQYFVLTKTATGTQQVPVTIGLIGDNGMTEIISGVNVGDTLINF